MKLAMHFPGDLNCQSPKISFWARKAILGPLAVVSPTSFPHTADVMRGKQFEPSDPAFNLSNALFFFSVPVPQGHIFNPGVKVHPLVLERDTGTDDLVDDLKRVTDDEGVLDCVAGHGGENLRFAVFRRPDLFAQLGL